jgi:hypothetical protein
MTKKQTPEESKCEQVNIDSIKKFLPKNYVKLIREQIKNAVSERMIQYVLNGKCTDSHGIIEVAINMANKEKKRRKSLAAKINQF